LGSFNHYGCLHPIPFPDGRGTPDYYRHTYIETSGLFGRQKELEKELVAPSSKLKAERRRQKFHSIESKRLDKVERRKERWIEALKSGQKESMLSLHGKR